MFFYSLRDLSENINEQTASDGSWVKDVETFETGTSYTTTLLSKNRMAQKELANYVSWQRRSLKSGEAQVWDLSWQDNYYSCILQIWSSWKRKTDNMWNKIIWSDETRIVPHYKHTRPAVKHGDGSVMLWECFSAAGPSETDQSWWENDGAKKTQQLSNASSLSFSNMLAIFFGSTVLQFLWNVCYFVISGKLGIIYILEVSNKQNPNNIHAAKGTIK